MMILGPLQLRLASSKFLYRYTSGLSCASSVENLTEHKEHPGSEIGESLAESDIDATLPKVGRLNQRDYA